MSEREPDLVLRIALASMAADPTSPLTVVQRKWIIDLAYRTDRFTAGERAKLKTPLLLWVKERMPKCEAIIQKQFSQCEGGDDR